MAQWYLAGYIKPHLPIKLKEETTYQPLFLRQDCDFVPASMKPPPPASGLSPLMAQLPSLSSGILSQSNAQMSPFLASSIPLSQETSTMTLGDSPSSLNSASLLSQGTLPSLLGRTTSAGLFGVASGSKLPFLPSGLPGSIVPLSSLLNSSNTELSEDSALKNLSLDPSLIDSAPSTPSSPSLLASSKSQSTVSKLVRWAAEPNWLMLFNESIICY
eukprot:TRINITY_DN10743_c0_g2_i2.p1 TRINITY_DN10743_c0_g2~~TRINITY_DN10743_c0_g2_i2.p1  ORF type:complete len:216 (-),score=6.14 TRINITY_DN10743_c0_g2_i2:34-681(-)